jgi:hypothetical protein
MTREQAEEALRQGKKVRHWEFMREAYILMLDERLTYRSPMFFPGIDCGLKGTLSTIYPSFTEGWGIVE